MIRLDSPVTTEQTAVAIQRMTTALHIQASHIHYCVPLAVPAALQTPEYAEATFRMSHRQDAAIDERLKCRLELQAQLYDTNKKFFFLISPVALETQRGGPEVLRNQLHALQRWSTRSNVEIKVFTAGHLVDQHLTGTFVIMDETVAIEYASGTFFLSDPEDIAAHQRHFEALWNVSAAGAAVELMIQKVLDELDVVRL